ncbi:hypothetical protein ACI4CU_28905, partial [Klebsiella pneumoniae]|uniref:hypothetical protein n=1 Tax=Klebsiella pneumoniae TaxID=573 RepID=UPI0038520CA3
AGMPEFSGSSGGSLLLSGAAGVKQGFAFFPTGQISLTGTAAYTNAYSNVAGTGNLTLSGAATITTNLSYSYTPTG